jgi:hypothetical protein
MRAEQSQRLSNCRTYRRRAEPFHQAANDAVRRFAGLNDTRSDPQAPRRSGCQQRGRFSLVAQPIACCELVFDEAIGRGRVGNAQQRFGERHQGQALFGRK